MVLSVIPPHVPLPGSGGLPGDGRYGESPRSGRVVRRGLSLTGAVLATAFYCLSLTPALLPRPWWLQGVEAGVTAVLGYALGAVLGTLTRALAGRRLILPARSPQRAAWSVVAAVCVVAVVVTTALSVSWQGDMRRAVGMRPQVVWWQWALVPVLAGLVAALLLGAARGLRLATRKVAQPLTWLVPRSVAYGTGIALVAFLVVGFVQGFLFKGVLHVVENGASLTDRGTSEGVVRPTSTTLSGGDGSYTPWDTLGAKGRDFVGGASTRADIARFTGRDAKDPVRVYVGLRTADSLDERARLAVRELERAGGFERDVLAVMGTTGTGWVNDQGSRPLEYLWFGDSALVAMQYSYLPSWVSVLTEDEAADASRALFTAVYDKWRTLPAETRPKLLAYGESLGSYAMENALGGTLKGLTGRTDGALFVGPTYANPLWKTLTDGRAPDSPSWRPVVGDGAQVRFAQVPSDYAIPAAPWTGPRSVYLQNGSDPVVWWSPDLAYRQPDWLDDPRAGDVSSAMRWYPVLTFWQVVCDLAGADAVPDGHGHRYGTMPTTAWAQITRPPGWTPERTAALAKHLGARP
ncbi:alpha/beta-hydrolase family protein [Streptomyces sp. NPDC001523]|uniref:alpha/beta hydrolase n=1 Tax=Streptomyces sp. NPDC001523 TaxID=3154383 RepID=UPI0033200833